MTRITRRRALFIAAAAAAVGLAPVARSAEARWRGSALGAHAEIRLRHLSQAEAAPLFAAVEAELARLEGIFSLYRPDSALSRLNRDGRLAAPPAELVELLTLARGVHGGTEGLFDPTVQPLFRLYAEMADADAGGDTLEQALALVGFEQVAVHSAAIHMLPGMALTLNGIAQGHVTDRIAALLRREGMTDVLVDIGEIAAIGASETSPGWPVRIEGLPRRLILRDRAIATSAPLGTRLGPTVGHILHPRHGWIAPAQAQVSVIADTAALADALSTAAALMTDAQLDALRARGIEAIAIPA